MYGHHKARLIVYVLFSLLVISSIFLAMPGAFSPVKSHNMDATGAPLPSGQHRFRIGQTISIRGIPFTFKKVLTDDRCGPGDSCSSPGHAVISLHINTISTEEDVNVDSTETALFPPYSIRIVSLTPIPTTGGATTEAIIEILDSSNQDQQNPQ